MPLVLASRIRTFRLGNDHDFFVIGQRINPTGRQELEEDIVRGSTELLLEEARNQVKAGSQALDVNVGSSPGRARYMKKAVHDLEGHVPVPLVLDSAVPELLAAGLEEAEGRVLINSVTGNDKSIEAMMPLVQRYRVPFVGLAIDERGVPGSWQERLRIARKILRCASRMGIAKEDVVIDPVLLPLRSKPDAILETLTALKAVKECLGVFTCLGVSNVSYGMKRRRAANARFLGLAMGFGLDMGMVDPLDSGVMEVARSRPTKPVSKRDVKAFREEFIETNG